MTQSIPAAVPTAALTQRSPDAVPREVHTWLQALGLGGTVKNVKRDLSNGCVLAQICAHYWEQVPLHSFNSGVSTTSKQSNWYVLQKVMRKHGVEVSATMVRGMIDGADDCAVAFLKQLYTIFTGRVVDETPVPLSEPLTTVPTKDVPAFAPANANSAAARARHAADGGTSFSGVLSASSSMAASRYGAAAGRADHALSFGTGGVSAVSFAPQGTAGGGGGGTARVVPASLPPLMPPPPAEAPFAAAAMASGKPALNVAVRPAGQVSTVLPSAAAAAAATNPSYLASSAAVGRERDGATSRGLPMGTALAATWFCGKVREALPAEVADAISSNSATHTGAASAGEALFSSSPAASSPLLMSTLAWLSTPEGAFDADMVCDGDGEETVRETQAMVRQRVWRSVIGSAHDLATLVLHRSPHGLDVLVDGLFGAVKDTSLCTAAGEEKSAGASFARNAVQLCAALLMHLSDVDTNAALRCFQAHFLASGAFAVALRRVRWCVAREYAALVMTALPAKRVVAAAGLESLWASIEDVVRDAADGDGREDVQDEETARTESEVGLVVLVRALVQTLLPLHTDAAAAARKRSSPPTVNATGSGAAFSGSHAAAESTRPSSSAMTRRKSQRTRSTHTTATATEENLLDALVVRLAHQRCTDALLHLTQGPPFSSAQLSAASVLLMESVAALAIDLLRVEAKTPLVRGLASGDAMLDVFEALFHRPDAHGDSEDGAAHEGTHAAPTPPPPPPLTKSNTAMWARHPALAVLRARWLRWCLQRRWQYNVSSRTSTAGVVGQYSTLQAPSLAASMGGLSDTEAPAGGEKEAWSGAGGVEEEWAVHRGLQVVCTELLTPLDAEEGEEREEKSVSAGDAAEKRTRQGGAAAALTAKVLMACAMAEALPFLPAQCRSALTAAAATAVNGSEANGGVMNVFSVNGGDNDTDGRSGGRTSSPRPLQQQQQVDGVYAEAVAEAVLHVLMREASTAQVRALLRPPSASPLAPSTPSPAAAAANRAQDGVVTLPHAFAGPLTFSGALVLRSDVLLLTKAMLCVLETMHASPLRGPSVEREVAVVARRLGARAAVMAREGTVEESLRIRIGWMHALLVEGRPSPTPPAGPSSTPAQTSAAAEAPPPLLNGDDTAVSQWHGIILDCWDTVMVVLQAATLRLRQRGGTAVAAAAAASSASGGGQVDAALLLEAVGENLLLCAQEAQELVRCLERELSSVLPGRVASTAAGAGTVGGAATSMTNEMTASASAKSEGVTLYSALLSGPVASFVAGTSPEEVQAAVGWMWTVVGSP